MAATTPTTTATASGLLNTTAAHNHSGTNTEEVPDYFYKFTYTLYSIIFILSIFANGLSILSILVFKKLRRIQCNYLILNLAVSDMLRAIFTTPFALVILSSKGFPFGGLGCKTIWPIATYTTNCSGLTLLCIAIERFIVISSIRFQVTKNQLFTAILLIHVISIASVIPYSTTLTFVVYYGTPLCYEAWYGTIYADVYTIMLFLFQYGLPLLSMIILYSMSWINIMHRNNRMIKISEEYERKIAREANSPHDVHSRDCNDNQTSKKSYITFQQQQQQQQQGDDLNSEKSSMSTGSEAREDNSFTQPPSYNEAVHADRGENIYHRNRASSLRASFHSVPIKTRKMVRKIKMLRKPKYISHIAYVRHQQTIRTLKMFTTIVIVFALFALPRQILWLLIQFTPELVQAFPAVIVSVFTFFAFLNGMTNYWICFAFNSSFRKAYKKIFLTIFPCLQKYWEMPHLFSNNTGSTVHTTPEETSISHEINTEHNTDHVVQQSEFDDMFRDHLNNTEKYQHLYDTTENDENEHSNLLSQPTPTKSNRKISTFKSLINALTPNQSIPNSPTLTSSITPRQFSMIPAIIPFTQTAESTQNAKKKGRKTTWSVTQTCEAPKLQSRPKSMDNFLDDIDINKMVLRESVEKSKPKRRKSVSDIGKEQREKQRGQDIKSLPTSPMRKKNSVFSFFSPKVSKKSDIKMPIFKGIVPVAMIGESNEDEIVTGKEVIVQATVAATINVKIGTAYTKMKDKTSKTSSLAKSDVIISSPSRGKNDDKQTKSDASFSSPMPMRGENDCKQTQEALTKPKDEMTKAFEDLSNKTNENKLSSANADIAIISSNELNPQGVQFETLDGHSLLVKNTTSNSNFNQTLSIQPKIPPIVPPKPKNNTIENPIKTGPDESQVSNIIVKQREKQQPIPSVSNRKKKLEKKLSDEHKERFNSIDRRESVKKLKDQQLVKIRSHSLEKSFEVTPVVKHDGSTEILNKNHETSNHFINNKNLTQQHSIEELKENSNTFINGHTTKNIIKIHSSSSDQSNCDNIHVPKTCKKKRQKLYKRPDISALMRHTISLPSLVTAKKTISLDQERPRSNLPSSNQIISNTEYPFTLNLTKGTLDHEQKVRDRYNLSPRDYSRKTSLTQHVSENLKTIKQ